jgi:hypothetical protein
VTGLRRHLLEAVHSPVLKEMRTLEQAIEVAESALSAGDQELMHEAGIFDIQRWKEMTAPFKAKAAAATGGRRVSASPTCRRSRDRPGGLARPRRDYLSPASHHSLERELQPNAVTPGGRL